MAYQIATSANGNLFVVLTMGEAIIRVIRKCENRDDANQLLRDLSGWVL